VIGVPSRRAITIVGRHLLTQSVEAGERGLAGLLRAMSWGSRLRARRQDRLRSRSAGKWFTDEEHALVQALASVVVPSDPESPGAREAGVAAAIDALVASSPSRQDIYTRGLADFEAQAVRNRGRRFVDLTPEEQLAIFRSVDERMRSGSGGRSVAGKVASRAATVYRTWRHPAIELLPRLIDDVLTTFYTSRSAWTWLGYDGPPMPQGYILSRDHQ
jgi:hypothetical protein